MLTNYVNSFNVGVLEIVGIYAQDAKLTDYLDEAINCAGIYDKFYFTIAPNGAFDWQCWQPLTCHGSQIIEETGGKLVCVYGTRNIANNVGHNEVKAILNCLFDGALV